MSFFNDHEYTDIDSIAYVFQNSSSTSQKRRICSVCNCTMDAGDDCIICQQDREYQNSLAIDSGGLLSFFPPFPEPSTPFVPVAEPFTPCAPGGESFAPLAEPSIPCAPSGESFASGVEPSIPCAPRSESDEELPDPTILRDRRCNHFDGSSTANLVKRHKLTIKGEELKNV